MSSVPKFRLLACQQLYWQKYKPLFMINLCVDHKQTIFVTTECNFFGIIKATKNGSTLDSNPSAGRQQCVYDDYTLCRGSHFVLRRGNQFGSFNLQRISVYVLARRNSAALAATEKKKTQTLPLSLWALT